jgi:hypothetical protein
MKPPAVAAGLLGLPFVMLLVVMALWPSLAHAQAACAPHDVMIERLADGWGEARLSVALDRAGNMIETYANLDTGTWTITVTTPGGPTCIIGAGQAFELVAEPAGMKG